MSHSCTTATILSGPHKGETHTIEAGQTTLELPGTEALDVDEGGVGREYHRYIFDEPSIDRPEVANFVYETPFAMPR